MPTPAPKESHHLTRGLYRPTALKARRNRLSDEHLEALPRIVPPFGWLLLAGLLTLLLALTVWGFVGRVPTTVSGQGILLRGGQVASITAQADGRIAELLVDVGDTVKPGQTVARVRQPTMETQIKAQNAIVASVRKRLEQVEQETESILKSQLNYIKKQRASVQTSIKDYEGQVKSLEKVVSAQQKLLAEGLVPLTSVIESQTLLDTTQLNLLAARNQLIMLESTELTYQSTAQQDLFEARVNLENELATLETQKIELEQGASVVSTVKGTIVEVNSAEGQDVTLGLPVFSVERTHEDMSAVLYFIAGVGKRIKPGMTAQVSPDSVPVDQYGFIVGKVTRVADVPATPTGMMAFLANENLVQSLTLTGPQLQVLSNLETDDKTATGFKWSSSKGPEDPVPAGTMVTARVIVEEQRPVELVIPLLKKFFGIVD